MERESTSPEGYLLNWLTNNLDEILTDAEEGQTFDLNTGLTLGKAAQLLNMVGEGSAELTDIAGFVLGQRSHLADSNELAKINATRCLLLASTGDIEGALAGFDSLPNVTDLDGLVARLGEPGRMVVEELLLQHTVFAPETMQTNIATLSLDRNLDQKDKLTKFFDLHCENNPPLFVFRKCLELISASNLGDSEKATNVVMELEIMWDKLEQKQKRDGVLYNTIVSEVFQTSEVLLRIGKAVISSLVVGNLHTPDAVDLAVRLYDMSVAAVVDSSFIDESKLEIIYRAYCVGRLDICKKYSSIFSYDYVESYKAGKPLPFTEIARWTAKLVQEGHSHAEQALEKFYDYLELAPTLPGSELQILTGEQEAAEALAVSVAKGSRKGLAAAAMYADAALTAAKEAFTPIEYARRRRKLVAAYHEGLLVMDFKEGAAQYAQLSPKRKEAVVGRIIDGMVAPERQTYTFMPQTSKEVRWLCEQIGTHSMLGQIFPALKFLPWARNAHRSMKAAARGEPNAADADVPAPASGFALIDNAGLKPEDEDGQNLAAQHVLRSIARHFVRLGKTADLESLLHFMSVKTRLQLLASIHLDKLPHELSRKLFQRALNHYVK